MSKKSTHVNILGTDIPLATIAYATSTVPGPIHATLGEWNNYYSESSPEFHFTLSSPIDVHEQKEYNQHGKD